MNRKFHATIDQVSHILKFMFNSLVNTLAEDQVKSYNFRFKQRNLLMFMKNCTSFFEN